MKIGIIGHGMVGSAVANYFKASKEIKIFIFDPAQGHTDSAPLYNADVNFVCVPTPSEDNIQDLSAVNKTFEMLRGSKAVQVVKSTVLPGTCTMLQATYGNKLVHNPEFLRAKTAKQDMFEQKGILLSGDAEDVELVKKAYLMVQPALNIITDEKYETTEMAKYMHNCFCATKVAFFNQFYFLASDVGVSYEEVLKMALAQEKIGENHTKVPGDDGFGYSGMCFPKDMVAFASEYKEKVPLIQAAEEYNKFLRKFEK